MANLDFLRKVHYMSFEATEKEFLIGIAITQFNVQFGKKFLTSDFDIMSIDPNSYSDRGYELVTIRLDDQVRLRMYVTFASDFFVSGYKLVNTGEGVVGGLGDEIYVSDVKIPSSYLEDGIYKFRTLTMDWSVLPITLTEQNLPFISNNGLYIIPERDPVYPEV